MDWLVHSPSFTSDSASDRETSMLSTERSWLFRLPPPERVGLNGEYDHSGLAKRVDRTLRQTFSSELLEQVTVTQRGRVVIFSGRLPTASLLRQFVAVAAHTSGATTVETHCVQLTGRSSTD